MSSFAVCFRLVHVDFELLFEEACEMLCNHIYRVDWFCPIHVPHPQAFVEDVLR